MLQSYKNQRHDQFSARSHICGLTASGCYANGTLNKL